MHERHLRNARSKLVNLIRGNYDRRQTLGTHSVEVLVHHIARRTPGGLIRMRRPAPIVPATQAAMLSLVTPQVCGSGSASRSQREGASTGICAAAIAKPISAASSTSALPVSREVIRCASWSIASTAIQCAASSESARSRSTRRTASAKGPPPGTISRREAAAASRTTARTPSKCAGWARRLRRLDDDVDGTGSGLWALGGRGFWLWALGSWRSLGFSHNQSPKTVALYFKYVVSAFRRTGEDG